MFTQPTTVFSMSFSDKRFDTASPQRLTDFCLGIISSICKNFFRSPSALTIGAFDRWHSINQLNCLLRVVDVCRRVFDCQRNPLAIAGNMPFRPIFTAIRRVWSGARPPKTARTEQLSKMNLSQSILSANPSLSNKIRHTFCHTPAWCQSRKRRQQVMPLPQPSSKGKYSQGQPVRRIKMIPLNAARSETRGRPPFGLGSCTGIAGSISDHNSSLTSTLGISCSSLNFRTLTKMLAPNNRFC
jgi:hypothetical protein